MNRCGSVACRFVQRPDSLVRPVRFGARCQHPIPLCASRPLRAGRECISVATVGSIHGGTEDAQCTPARGAGCRSGLPGGRAKPTSASSGRAPKAAGARFAPSAGSCRPSPRRQCRLAAAEAALTLPDWRGGPNKRVAPFYTHYARPDALQPPSRTVLGARHCPAVCR
jgi:hypothetical protein